nr:protein W09G3.4 [imported] - Caenorhabditis elegans [Caenorhabditis elegans]
MTKNPLVEAQTTNYTISSLNQIFGEARNFVVCSESLNQSFFTIKRFFEFSPKKLNIFIFSTIFSKKGVFFLLKRPLKCCNISRREIAIRYVVVSISMSSQFYHLFKAQPLVILVDDETFLMTTAAPPPTKNRCKCTKPQNICILSVDVPWRPNGNQFDKSRESTWKKPAIRGVNVISENCGQLTIARRSPACFLAGNQRILVAGGCSAPNEHTDSMEMLEISEIGEIRSIFLDEKLEIGASCSGFDWDTHSSEKPIFGGFEAHSCLDDVQVLNNSGTMWKCRKLAKKSPKIKNSTILEVKNGEFLMFGGWEDEQRTSKAIRRITFNEDFTDYSCDFAGFLSYPVEAKVFIFHLKNPKFIVKILIFHQNFQLNYRFYPQKFQIFPGHTCIQIDSSVFLIGGFDGCFVLDSIIKYDLKTGKSEVLDTKLRGKRENHVACVLGDTWLVVAGGWNSRQALDDVEVFEIRKIGGKIELAPCQVAGKLNFARNRPNAEWKVSMRYNQLPGGATTIFVASPLHCDFAEISNFPRCKCALMRKSTKTSKTMYFCG